MSTARRWLCGTYYAIALIAFIGTWRQNIAFMQDLDVNPLGGFVAFVSALLVNRASISITVDIVLFMLAAVIWMVLEARRLGIRHVWLYVLFGMTVAISVTFPLFLAARERRLATHDATATEPAPTATDKLGLGIFSGLSVAFTLWCTLQ